jgi:chromosome segregation ATPase
MTDDRIGVDVQTAARQLDVTPAAIRARLKRGTLGGEKRPDGTWIVYLPEDARPPGEPSTDELQAELVRELRRQIEDLRHDKGELQDQVEILSRTNAAYQQQVEKLTRRLLPPAEDDEDGAHRETTPQSTASWWDRIQDRFDGVP